MILEAAHLRRADRKHEVAGAMSIATRVVDFMHGGAATGIPACLERKEHHGWVSVVDGHAPDLAAGDPLFLERGVYRLTFDMNAYFAGLGMASRCQEIALTFTILNPDEHSDLTLMVAPHGHIAVWRRAHENHGLSPS